MPKKDTWAEDIQSMNIHAADDHFFLDTAAKYL